MDKKKKEQPLSPPDPGTKNTTDPQEKMKGPISSLVQNVKETVEENDEESKEEADEREDKNT